MHNTENTDKWKQKRSKQTSLSPEKTSPVIIAMIAVGPIVTSFVLKKRDVNHHFQKLK